MKQLIKSGVIEDASLVVAVEAVGRKRGKGATVKMSAVFPSLRQIPERFMGATYVSYPTGTAAYAFLKIIPKLKIAGVFPPEALDNEARKSVMLNLKENGIVIRRQFQKK